MQRIEIPDDEVHLWLESLVPDTARLKRAENVLSKEELDGAGRFLREVDRNRYLIGHLRTREILTEYVGVDGRELKFAIGEFGKPELDEKSNREKLRFNISHSGDRLLLGLTKGARIGVDIEEIRAEFATLDVATRFFTAKENDALRTLTGTEQVEGFFRCWTRKEAYLKALGCGLSVSPTDCEVTLLPGDEPKLIRPVPHDNTKEWQMFSLRGGKYLMAIAVDRLGLVVKQKSG